MRREIVEFRRLCVSYGEARAKANREDAPDAYRKAWRGDCDALWQDIEKQEKRLMARMVAGV